MDTTNLHWLAGYLEGEACFNIRPASIEVSATDREPLHKCLKICGGRLVARNRKTMPAHYKPVWRWTLSPRQGVLSVLRAIRPLMSPRRRRRIAAVIKFGESRRPKALNGSGRLTPIELAMYHRLRRLSLKS